MKVLLRAGCLGLAACWLAGCASTDDQIYFRSLRNPANVFVAPTPSRIRKVAIMPFKGPTELIGISVSDLFVTEMLRANRYELVERGQMAKVLSEAELSLAGLSAARAAEVGQMLGADGVVIGTVDEYSTVAQSGHPYPVVGISARLIDCGSGKVMWSVDLAKRAESKELTLPEQARSVAHAMVATLYQRWQVQPIVERAPVHGTDDQIAPSPERTAPLPTIEPGVAPASGAAAQSAPAALQPPLDFKVSDMGLREVVLTWSAPAQRGIEYRIERAAATNGPFEALATVAAGKLAYRDQGARGQPLRDAATYYYRLVAVAGRAESAPSPVKESLTAPAPEPPAQLRAETPAARTVHLFWKPAAAEQALRYIVERAGPGDGETFERIGETGQAEFRDGTPSRDGAGYVYRVTASNRVGAISTPAATVKAVTRPPPAQVQNAAATSGELRCVTLSWKPAAEADVVRYEIWRAVQDGEFAPLTFVQDRDSATWLDGGPKPAKLADGAAYSYKIRAINASELSGLWSSTCVARTKSPPPAPGRIDATYGSGWIKLAWPALQQELATYRIWKKGLKEPLGLATQPAYTLRFGEIGRRATVSVTALGQDGLESAPSVALELEEPAPPVPQELAVTTNGLREVVLRWRKPDDNAKQYRIDRAIAPGGPFETLAQVSPDDGEYRDAGLPQAPLADSSTYFYRLVALAANGRASEAGSAAQALTAAPPAPPPSAKAEPSAPRKLKVSWAASPSEGVISYVVERGLAAGPENFSRCGATKDTFFEEGGTAQTDLKDNTAYLYRIRAINRVGSTGAPSQPVAVTTQPPPAPPDEISATAPASRAIQLSWTASKSELVVKYIVERALAEDPEHFARRAEVDQTTFSEGGSPGTDLRDSTKYLYRITAVNALGVSGPASAPAGVTTRPAPAAVRGITAQSGEVRCVPLAWLASPEPDVLRYDIYRRVAPDRAFEKIDSVEGRSKTTFLDGGRDPGNLADQHAYDYRIRCINAVTSESPDSETMTAATRGAPPAVTGLRTRAGRAREMPLAWDASPDEKVIGYEILRQAPGEHSFTNLAEVAGRESTAYVDRGGARGNGTLGQLADGAEYSYQVVAFNTARVRSAPSAAAAARTKPAPAAPQGLTATSQRPKQIKLAWPSNRESDVMAYAVESAADAHGRFRELARVEATAGTQQSALESELGDGVARVYRVKAVDRDTLESAWSEIVQGKTKPLPAAPSGLKSVREERGVTLTWIVPPQPDIKRYKVWRKKFFGAEELANTAEPQARLTDSQAGNGISVFVTAVDADGLESPRSVPLAIAGPAASGGPE